MYVHKYFNVEVAKLVSEDWKSKIFSNIFIIQPLRILFYIFKLLSFEEKLIRQPSVYWLTDWMTEWLNDLLTHLSA